MPHNPRDPLLEAARQLLRKINFTQHIQPNGDERWVSPNGTVIIFTCHDPAVHGPYSKDGSLDV